MGNERYTFSVTVSGDLDEVEAKVREALSQEGFGVLTEIDMAATLKTKIGYDMPGYKVLGACNPPLAKRGLDADPLVGALLPCNVVVRDLGDGTTQVAFADPDAMLALADDERLVAVGAEARSRLLRVADALRG